MHLSPYQNGKPTHWHYALVLMFSTTLLQRGDGLRIAQCVSNMAEVDMESSDNEITCDGADPSETITWSFTGVGTNSGTITCRPSEGCTENNLFTATRGSQLTSSTVTPRVDIKRFRTIYGAITLSCHTSNHLTNVETDRASCELDVVHHAEVTSCSAQFNTAVGMNWTASGSCVISKAFSQRGRYSCLWTEIISGTSTEIQSSLTFTGPPDEGEVPFRSMTCDFLKSLPRVTGRYSYTAVISPGAVQPDVNFTGSSSIILPTAHTDCPTDYVMEGNNVDCTCSSTDGNPAGSAVWRVPSGSSRLVLNDVRRDNHSDIYVCEVKWSSDVVSNVTFRLQVAYGPDTATINGTQPFDTDGTKDMTLNCTAGNSQPGVTYQWRRLSGRGMVESGNQITLTNVDRLDDGDKIECTAVNTKFSAGLRASRNVTLDLHYPPTQAPVIHNSSSANFVYQGDPLTYTCTVSDGKPVNATTLTFDCPDREDRNDVQSTTGVSSSVTFDSVVASNNGDVCTCRGRWKAYTDWYTLQTQTTVVVYYAPTKPVINAGSQPYPFLAGESPTLYCNYPARSDPGNPNATLTLNGQAGGTGQGQVSVTLGELSSTYNGRRMVCESSNKFTVHTNTSVTTETLLQVYYHPVISVTSDTCSLSTSSSSITCVVMEGQRVKVNCTAHSNPSIATIAWQPGGNSDLDLQADRATDIDHNCDVTTVDEDGNGNRLPLHNSKRLTVLVKYLAEMSGIEVNGDVINDTVVNETDTFSLNCTARGRPTAGIVLKKNGNVIRQINVGDVTRDDVTVLMNTTQHAQCEDAGLYTCSANNEIGDPDEQGVKVFVNCRPRLARQDETPTIINHLGHKETVYIDLISYPVPNDYTLLFTGLFGNANKEEAQPARGDMYNVTCAPTDNIPSASTNCSLTVFSVAENDKGFYELTLANQWGHESIIFQLDINRTEISQKDAVDVFPIAGAVGGIAAAIAVVAILAFIIIYTRRKRDQKSDPNTIHRQRPAEHYSDADDSEMIVNELYGTSRNENNEMIVNELYGTTGRENTGFYESHGDTAQHAYEDVVPTSTRRGAPTVQGAGTTGSGDVYASVKKSQQNQGASATVASADDNVYSTVDKKKKITSPSVGILKSSKAKTQKPDVMKKPTKKSASGKPPKNREMNQNGTEYTNMTPLSMSPPETQATVYENVAFQADDVLHENNGAVDGGKSETTNADELLYTTIAFNEEQLKKAEQPPPERETTEYVDIDFVRTGRK